MKKFHKTAALCTAICAMTALVHTANAVAITSVTLNSSGPANPDVNFQGWLNGEQIDVPIPGGTLSYNNSVIVQSNTDSEGAKPFPSTGDYLSVKAGGNATFEFTGVRSSFGLQWGSVDTYNTITFWLAGNPLLGSAFNGNHIKSFPTGTDLILDRGNQGMDGSAYVTFSGAFDKVVLTSTQNSFEVDNISVPDGGSTLALLGGVLAMVGVYSRKLRK